MNNCRATRNSSSLTRTGFSLKVSFSAFPASGYGADTGAGWGFCGVFGATVSVSFLTSGAVSVPLGRSLSCKDCCFGGILGEDSGISFGSFAFSAKLLLIATSTEGSPVGASEAGYIYGAISIGSGSSGIISMFSSDDVSCEASKSRISIKDVS